MKKNKPIKAYYVGDEFPDYYGQEIQVRDDYSSVNNPCYEIRFQGESRWYDNMDDDDWSVTKPEPKKKKCKSCDTPVHPSENYCGECLCEDDSGY